MRIKVGYKLTYDCVQPTPLVLRLSIHPSRASDMIRPDGIFTMPELPVLHYPDAFGNICSSLVAPAGELALSASAVVRDDGLVDAIAPNACQVDIPRLPTETMQFLLGSRYCETDLLSELAWDLFDASPPGWQRVQTICDFVHDHIKFGYEYASSSKTALQAFNEASGVCRDYTHLAIAFCRCMNIPARYCTGYLGDIGVPAGGPMDFSAWLEAYLDGVWYVFDPRNNERRIGRILIARGRDAADVPFSHSFGRTTLKQFEVFTDELVE